MQLFESSEFPAADTTTTAAHCAIEIDQSILVEEENLECFCADSAQKRMDDDGSDTVNVHKMIDQSGIQIRDRQRIVEEKNLIRQRIRCSLKKEKETRTTLSELQCQLESAEREKNRLLQDRLALEKRGNVNQQQNLKQSGEVGKRSRRTNDAWRYANMQPITESVSNHKSSVSQMSKLPRRRSFEKNANRAAECQPEPVSKEAKSSPSILNPELFEREDANKGIRIVQDYLAALKCSDTLAKTQKDSALSDGTKDNLFFKHALDLELAVAERQALEKSIVEIESPVLSSKREARRQSIEKLSCDSKFAELMSHIVAGEDRRMDAASVLACEPLDLSLVDEHACDSSSGLTSSETLRIATSDDLLDDHLMEFTPASSLAPAPKGTALHGTSTRGSSHLTRGRPPPSSNSEGATTGTAVAPPTPTDDSACRQASHSLSTFRALAAKFDATSSPSALAHKESAGSEVDGLAVKSARSPALPSNDDNLPLHRAAVVEGVCALAHEACNIQSSTTVQNNDLLAGKENAKEIGNNADIDALLASLNCSADRLYECFSDAQDLRQTLKGKMETKAFLTLRDHTQQSATNM